MWTRKYSWFGRQGRVLPYNFRCFSSSCSHTYFRQVPVDVAVEKQIVRKVIIERIIEKVLGAGAARQDRRISPPHRLAHFVFNPPPRSLPMRHKLVRPTARPAWWPTRTAIKSIGAKTPPKEKSINTVHDSACGHIAARAERAAWPAMHAAVACPRWAM